MVARQGLVPGWVPLCQVSQQSSGAKWPRCWEAQPPRWLGTEGPRAESAALELQGQRCRPGLDADLSRPAAAGRTSSRSQSLRSTDARRREELGHELQQFGFPSPQTGELRGWAGLTRSD